MLMNNHDNINIPVSISCHPISKRSCLKYLGVTLDDELNWKLQIEKLCCSSQVPTGALWWAWPLQIEK